MSFRYPRTISIYRHAAFPAGSSGYGAQGYQEPATANGVSVWSSTPIASGVICSIQEYRSGQRPVDNLPGDVLVTPTHKIFVPRAALALGVPLIRDFIQDDGGLKYQIINPYWNSLGYRLYCVYLVM